MLDSIVLSISSPNSIIAGASALMTVLLIASLMGVSLTLGREPIGLLV
jgi:hypothetical protein